MKDSQLKRIPLQPPLTELTLPQGWFTCSCKEVAEVFYCDQEQGSNRSAGMMLDKLAVLGLIRKRFDGNCTQIEIQAPPELLHPNLQELHILLEPDQFDPRCDAVPIANLLASNYQWLNRSLKASPYRIANILRDWAEHYATGMRVLRRGDNHNPLGFYALYPTQSISEAKFFSPPSQGLHLSQVTAVDPFLMASPGDLSCRAVFVRSWMIDRPYRQYYRAIFLRDAQQTMVKLRQDFPNLWDMHTLIIHPSYEDLAQALGFQKACADPKLPIRWMYQSVDRFLELNMEEVAGQLSP
ncbi:MAG: hypothetical protein HC792_04480 [Acaryochloridaceae cyanobacterium CSU_5_19]|nr:hypothetical protein [Acaryochloridaceae cyanobacterium CSU_5_19]